MLDPNALAVCKECDKPIIADGRQIVNDVCFDHNQVCICGDPIHYPDCTLVYTYKDSTDRLCKACYIGRRKGDTVDIALDGAFPDMTINANEAAKLPCTGRGVVVGGRIDTLDDGKKAVFWQVAVIVGLGWDAHRNEAGELWLTDIEIR